MSLCHEALQWSRPPLVVVALDRGHKARQILRERVW